MTTLNWINIKYRIVKSIILDIIFPIQCLSCQSEGEWLCERCVSKLKLYNYHLCPICQVENKDGSVCGYCKSYSNLDGLFVVLEKSLLTQKMIHFIKYNYIIDIFPFLKPKLIDHYLLNPHLRDFFVLVPVPLHPRRYLSRGFNQSEIICNLIKETKGNRIDSGLLKKIKFNHHQVGLNANKRHENIDNSFVVNYETNTLKSDSILIVDDVYTTGSTLDECAKVLKLGGYTKVWALVLIRG